MSSKSQTSAELIGHLAPFSHFFRETSLCEFVLYEDAYSFMQLPILF